MAQATVVAVTREGIVLVQLRRNYREDILYGTHTDLRVGQKIQVVRKVNNPYVVRVNP